MFALWLMLLVAVCCSGVNAHVTGRGSANNNNNNQESDSDNQAHPDNTEHASIPELLESCSALVRASCGPIGPRIEFLWRNTVSNLQTVLKKWFRVGIRESCGLVYENYKCYNNVVHTQCSAESRRVILRYTGPIIAATLNVLEYICVQNTAEVDSVARCVNEKQLKEGINVVDVAFSRCQIIRDNDDRPPMFCEKRDMLDCPIEVLKSYCGEQAGATFDQLFNGIFSSAGCDDFANKNGISTRADNKSSPSNGGENPDGSTDPTLIEDCSTLVQTVCGPLHNGFLWRDTVNKLPVVLNKWFQVGIRESCRLVYERNQCANNVLHTQCSVEARRVILRYIGPLLAATTNVLQYICVQHTEDVENVAACVNDKKLQENIEVVDVAFSRCRIIKENNVRPPMFCGKRDMLDCPIEVLKSYCGEQAGATFYQLFDGIFSSAGCDDIANKRGVAEIMRLIRRAFP